MSEVKEQLVYVNWRALQGRSETLGFRLLAILFWAGVLGLLGASALGAAYIGHLPWRSQAFLSLLCAAGLAGFALAGIILLFAVRKQQRKREWSSTLTLFVVLVISAAAFAIGQPTRLPVTAKPAVASASAQTMKSSAPQGPKAAVAARRK